MEEAIKRAETEATELPAERTEQTESFQELIRGKYREDYLKALGEALSAQARETRRYLAYRELMIEAEAVKARYPDFDLERELEDPGFARLLNSGVDPRTAYEVSHHDELMRRAARLERNAAHPQENGLGGAPAAAVTRPDPRQLTRAERRALRRRAARGEEIVW